MSERTQAPRSGGRAAEPQRPATGRRDTGMSRDADTPGNAARGARRFAGEAGDGGARRSDTRRSGTRDSREPRRAAGNERGRGSKVDAPIAGATALKIEAEPLRATDAAPAPRLQVAPPPPIHGGLRAPFAAGLIGVVIVGVLGILLINTKTNENSFRITDLQKQNTALENQQQDLDNQLVNASSIGNLDAAARRLGLVKAEKVGRIRLPDGKIIYMPGPAEGKVAITHPDAVTDKGEENISPADGTGTGTGLGR